MKAPLSVISLITLIFPVMLCVAKDYSRSGAESSPATGKVSRIVIDAGHGGKDPGTNFGKVLEKDITLDIALKLGAMVKQNMPDVEVFYTRTKDLFVELNTRTDIANRANADLFVSIHVNAAKSSTPNGVRTYIMGHDKSGANFDIVMKENEVIKYEDNFETTYEGFKADDPVSYMIFQLQQFSYQSQSMMMAEIIQKHYARELPLTDGGAFQDGFLVLWRTSMPSVLTEVGFMTNKSDREYISSEKGRSEAARSLFNAFSEYRSRIEGRSSMVQLQPEDGGKSNRTGGEGGKAQTTSPATAQSGSSVPSGQNSRPNQTTATPASAAGSATSEKAGASSNMAAQQSVLPDITAGNANEQNSAPAQGGNSAYTASGTPMADNEYQQTQSGRLLPDISSGSVSEEQDHLSAEQAPTGQFSHKPAAQNQPPRSGIVFYIQVLASRTPVNIHSSVFKSYQGRIEERYVPGGEFNYKYLLGGVPYYERAEGTLAQLKREFPGAFIVAFDGDRQISVAEARKR